MLTIAEFFVKVAKWLRCPPWVISHGVVLILGVGGTVGLIAIATPVKQNINQVPIIMKYLAKMDSSNALGHNFIIKRIASIDSAQRRQNYLFREKIHIDSMKFSRIKLPKDSDYFRIMDEWFYRLQSISLLEKKNNSLSTLLPNQNRTN